MQSLLILGRQPTLGLAELESLYGEAALEPIGTSAAIVNVDPCLLAYDRLGGTLKFAKVLTVLSTNNWEEVEQFLIKVAPQHSESMPDGKMTLGLSLYGFNMSPKDIMSSGLKLKKAIQKTGRSVRYVPNKQAYLNSAQVIHNKLLKPNGWELVIINDNNKTYIAQTVKVQDIEAYAERDQNRPRRDSRVGMLPPKLAQIIINLAVGILPEESRQSVCDIPPDEPIPLSHYKQNILDPFCGSGVVLQEALLMGYDVIGSDIDKRMTEFSIENVYEWFYSSRHPNLKGSISIAQADATKAKWPTMIWDKTNRKTKNEPLKINFVATETFLGEPYLNVPEKSILNSTLAKCNSTIKDFLENIAGQIEPGTRLCLAVPAWQIEPGKFKQLPLIDQISTLGYNLVSFKHTSDEDLIYYRPGQIVARRLLVITRR